MSTADRGRRGRRLIAAIAFGLGVLLLVAGGLTTIARSVPFSWVPIASDDWAMATSFTDFGIIAYALSLVCLGVALIVRASRLRVVVGVLALGLAVLHASWIVPWFIADSVRPDPTTPVFRILALNMGLGRADPAVVVGAANSVDIVVLTEATKPAHQALLVAGLGDRFPYEQQGGYLPVSGAGGTTVFSRFPIIATTVLPAGIAHQNWLVRIDVPGTGAVALAAVHPTRPFPGGTDWLKEQNMLHTAVVSAQPDVVAGDFNAVDNHLPIRRLSADGFRSTTDSAGAGWQPTYPADRTHLPPIAPIDHILIRPGLAAAESHTVRIPGTDHLGVVATIGRVDG